MAAAIKRWWQMIHNGGTPTAITVDPGAEPAWATEDGGVWLTESGDTWILEE